MNKEELIQQIRELNLQYSQTNSQKEEKKILQKIKKISKQAGLYDIEPITETFVQYHMIIGQRSNGKTYAVQEEGIKNYCLYNKQMALIRRWDTDYTGKRGRETFSNMVKNNVVSKWSKGKFNTIIYRASQWFLAKKFPNDEEDTIIDDTPFCQGFSLNVAEHDKSTAYPDVTTILFDEFLSRKGYINDEFVEFMNVISTIIRHRNDVKVFMCGNTVNRFAPYFNEMGLYNVKNQKEGTIDTYTYGDSGMKVKVEYCAQIQQEKEDKKSIKGSETYFAFNNPKLQMITTGAWEIDIYPHLMNKFKRKEILFTYYVEFDRELLEINIVQQGVNIFSYVHRKTTPLKELSTDLVYTQRYSDRPNITRRINKPRTNLERRIWWLIQHEKTFYQDNEVGEIMRNYIMWANKENII